MKPANNILQNEDSNHGVMKKKNAICVQNLHLKMSSGFGAGNCEGVKHYKKDKIKEYGTVNEVDYMKAEIYARDPNWVLPLK